jgi:large subunit ribosomal protein L5e
MGFQKQIKSKPYFKRYQVKYRRRREGKTDYYARKRLVCQDRNKYNSPKYRLVVRFSNKDVITQIVYAKITGDFVLAAAYAHELKEFGMPVATTNYAAAYATGLLLARRVLTKLNLADKYQGNQDVNGSDYNVEALDDGPKPFYALLDVGLKRTTTGSKIFAALKGATDGGLEVPHSETRFVGYDEEGKKLNTDILRKYIFGGHVKEYMEKVKKADPTKYEKHFSKYVANKIDSANLEATWAKVHKAIRATPLKKAAAKPKPEKQKRHNKARISLAQRRDKIKQKLAHKAKQDATKADEE